MSGASAVSSKFNDIGAITGNHCYLWASEGIPKRISRYPAELILVKSYRYESVIDLANFIAPLVAASLPKTSTALASSSPSPKTVSS